MADNAPQPGGAGSGALSKRRRRKRGGGGGGGANNSSKDAPSSTAGNAAASSSGGGGGRGGGGGNKGRKRGNGGGGGRGGGGDSSSRMNKNASSPLQLPHVKVTLRNIGNSNKNSTVEGVVDSIRSFLDGAFPGSHNNNSNSGGDNNNNNSNNSGENAYMMAWQLEKEEFEHNKNMFAEAVSTNKNSADESSSSSSNITDATSSIRAFSSGVYKDRPSVTSLPSDRNKLLPSPEIIVSDMNDAAFTSPSSMIDTAMSKMIQECGKQYINYVGGRVILDEESAVDCMLAEQIQEEMKKRKESVSEQEDGSAAANTSNDKPSSVETVTKGMQNLSTSDRNNNSKSNTDAIRVRILSVTPMKKSKRRGDIYAKVQLVLYPPDPCLLFQDLCRDTGKLVAEKHSMANENDKVGAVETDQPTEDKTVTTPKAPQIPTFPLLSSSERSRALARSRILINRTIEAMKIHAKSMNTRDNDNRPWEVFESPSQKTWKQSQNPMIGSLMAGTSLQDALVEYENSKSNVVGGGGGTANKKGRGGFKSREDRYDSTIENSEDYKSFMEHWLKDGAYPTKDVNGSKKKEVDPIAVDEEGRPLAAIVMDIRKKKDEEAKKNAEAKAAAARARDAARSAQDALKKKEKAKKKKEKDRIRRNERKKKAKAAASGAPRPQPTLLQHVQKAGSVVPR